MIKLSCLNTSGLGHDFETVKKIIDFSTEVQRRITDAKSIEDAYTIQTEELEKRLWETNFLYSMPKILNYLDQPKEEPFLKILDLIKETWKMSNLSIKINYEEREYKTDNFNETEWKQSSDIIPKARTALETGDYRLVGNLMFENHRLLQEIEVSCSELDLLVNIARENGAWGAKMTGSGFGGYMIALTPTSALQDKVATAIKREGFEVLKTTIGI